MILGIGNDLANIERIGRTVERFGARFLDRVYTETEQALAERRRERIATYAKRWAAKEACSKALGTGLRMGISWRDMGVVNLPDRPADDGAHRLGRRAPGGDDPARPPRPRPPHPDRRPPLGDGRRRHRGRAGDVSARVPPPRVRALTGPGAGATRRRRRARVSRDRRMATKSKAKGGFLEIVKTIVYALLLAGVIRTLFFQPFWIPSGSMKPTLLIGDFLFVNKMAYGYSRYSCPFAWICPFDGRILAHDPERGDVVVFRHPTNGTDYIKRLIGLPGDTRPDDRRHPLHQRRGPAPAGRRHLRRDERAAGADGQHAALREPPRARARTASPSRRSRRCPAASTHAVLDIENGFGDTTPVFTVPAGEFFFMGDNRDNSMDSRFPRSAGGVGFVPFENLIGRADRVIFSSGRRLDARVLDLAARPVLQGHPVKLGRATAAVAGRLGHDFARPELLIEALTHPSTAAGQPTTSASSSSATASSASSSPRPCSPPTRRRPRATSPRASTPSSARRPAPRSPPSSTSAPACAWAAPRC